MLAQARRLAGGLLLGALTSALIFLAIAGPRGRPIELLPPPTQAPLQVHVAGAVEHPGVYELPRGSIVEDAIQAAGGAAPGADTDRVNLAAELVGGERILVPVVVNAQAGDGRAAPASDGLLNLNSATADELETLPGIGPGLAQSIVEYREGHGPFAAVEDLLLVPGIGPSRLTQIRELVTVN
jgi:competence protein ComEA